MSVERLAGPVGATYSEGVVVSGPGRWIHVAGQVATGPDGKVVDGDLGVQTNVTLNNIQQILERAGADLRHVIRITAYLKSLDEYTKFAHVRSERFAEGFPASAAVQVADLLLGAAIEIDAIAFVPDEG